MEDPNAEQRARSVQKEGEHIYNEWLSPGNPKVQANKVIQQKVQKHEQSKIQGTNREQSGNRTRQSKLQPLQQRVKKQASIYIYTGANKHGGSNTGDMGEINVTQAGRETAGENKNTLTGCKRQDR